MPSRNLNTPLDRFLSLDIQSENKPSFHVKMCGEGTNVSMKMGMCVMSFSLFSPDVAKNASSPDHAVAVAMEGQHKCSMGVRAMVRNKLLSFVTQKLNYMPTDSIVQLCPVL